MFTKRIIPCLDIKDGKVVKGVNFVNLTDIGDPIEISKIYQEQGADEIVLLNIDGKNQDLFYKILEQVATQIVAPITIGGGIYNLQDFEKAFACSAAKVSINTAAVQNPTLIKDASDKYGKRIVVAIDAKRVGNGYNVFIQGGKEDTGLDLITWAKKCESLGACEILLTSMDGDGTQNGYDIEMTKAVVDSVKIPVIASGGCGKALDIVNVFEHTKCSAALAASIFHYGKVSIQDVKKQLAESESIIDGLIPAIVQDFYTGRVLMLAYVNQESFEYMKKHGETCFWSRSRQELWHKGATSGNVQKIKHMAFDCDNDTLLLQVEQIGDAACHTGSFSCFAEEHGDFYMLERLQAQIKDRSQNPTEKSYTNYLLEKGVDKICKKVGEEAAETIIAAKNNDTAELTEEISDLMYHIMVLMFEQGLTIEDIRAKLVQRHK